MSGTNPNNKPPSRSQRRKQNQNQRTATALATNVETASGEPLFALSEDFPSLHDATSNRTVIPISSLHQKQPMIISNIHDQQSMARQSSEHSRIDYSIKPLKPSNPLLSQTTIIKNSNTNENSPTTVNTQTWTNQLYATSEQQPTMTITSRLTQAFAMKPAITNKDDNPSQPIVRDLTRHENEINKKISEIILTIHESKEFVSRERVQRELFDFYHVKSWSELKVHASRFNPLINLTDRQKDVNFYMNVFEQIFNLCTLHDLDVLLARFLKVEKYEDLRLGPLEKNPDVQRVFAYNPTKSNQPILPLTTGQVINRFIEFQKGYRRQRSIPFDEFLDQLVEIYELQSREELGIFCKSFPFLVQVIGSVRREQDWHSQQVREQFQREFIEDLRTRLNEFKEKMQDEMEFSSFNKKKTPTAVFNYLTSIVENYLDFIPQQTTLYATLVQFRENELLRCLLNISIYLGTIEKPEVFIAELKKLLNYQEKIPLTQTTMPMQSRSILNEIFSKKDRKKMQAMIQQQQLSSTSQPSQISSDDLNLTTNTPVHTSFASSLLSSHQSKPKPPVTLKQLCSDIYNLLIHHDNVLTIKQLLRIEGRLCTQHAVNHFSVFNYDENDDDNDNPSNLLSFLDKYRQQIDPHGELSVYEQISSTDDRQELYSFIQQLNIINNNEIDDNNQQHIVSIHGHINSDYIHLSTEKLSAIEKAIKHKFHGSIHFYRGNQMIKKAKQQHRKNDYSIIRFEESLLDINGLNRLDICPTSLNIDENQLCQLILHCPLMTDLHIWLQWLYFFQPKYGTLKSFIIKHENEFKGLRLLETSTRELFRLPNHTTLDIFERELHAIHIRSAVGHLCALIIQEGLITRFSFNVYRTSMDTWFRHLRSLATLQNDQINPMQCILDFLLYLPVLIGQSRVIEELILGPLDDVFGNDQENTINARTRIWNIATKEQRLKLELWGHIVNIMEWKNENKWLGQEDFEEQSIIKSEIKLLQNDNIDNPVTSLITPMEPPIVSSSKISTMISNTPTENDENDPIRAAYDHIESIRHGFGVDSGLDTNGQSIVNNLQGMIERSLEKLSNDLYSDQGHFVLELIQNADDNQYLSNYLPTLRFILSSERILVCNNEIGFQPNNISAICNVGASTKGKHKQGYAGHKGIGFKSVFMISHRPEIHSRNYHLRFDTVNGTKQIGYIRPIWLDEYEEILPNSDEWTTCIRLPIKQETRRDRLQRNFDDIQARLLLFLNRLRQIEIINQSNLSSRVFTRIDHAQGQIIELQEKTNNESIINNFWLVIKKVIEVPMNIKEKLRDVKGDVDSTTIAVAYSLSGIQESSNQLPATQPLFAYLPLRSYGFRFILQADFEIPATRQEIRRDNLWNEWLKSEMTCLLSLAYLQFKNLPDLLTSSSIHTQINNSLTPIQTIKYFLKLIPSRNELDPYFNSFVDESIKLLTGIIHLPILRQNENDEMIIDWVLPSKCVIVRDPFIRKILSQDLLISHFNSYYVHEQLVLECDEQILLKLGCRQLDFSDITRLIEISYKQNEQERPKTISSIEQIAQWLVCLDYSLQQKREQIDFDHDEQEEKETIIKLKQMKILPLKQQSYLVSVNEFDKHAISFPLDKSVRYSKHLKLVLNDIPTLDEQLLNFIEDKYPRRYDSIKHLLKNLGISDLRNIHEIYRQHISPVLLDPARWSLKSESVLMAYLMCIYEYIYLPNRGISENELKILQNNMIIKTRDNKFVSLGSPDVVVHLTAKYGCRRSLEFLKLSNHQFIFISDDYYNEYRTELFRTDSDLHPFVSFLKELNLSDFLQINLQEKRFINVAQLADTEWAYLIPQLSESIYEPFLIKDCSCKEFDKLVSLPNENQTENIELCIRLLQYLHDQHRLISTYYSASVYLVRTSKYNQSTPEQGIESSFCFSLRRHAWIPVIGNKLYKPNEVYLLSSDNQTSVFQQYLPHLDVSKVSLNNKDFIFNILGIKSQVTHQTIFELLMKWSCDLDSETLWNLVNGINTSDIIPCTLPNTFRQSCVDTIENFCQIYQFLASNNEIRMLINRFRLWPLIFIPRGEKLGDFLFAHQTFWNDPLSILSSQNTIADFNGRIPIRPYYDNPLLQSFFLDILHVESQPTIDDYIPLLSTIQDIDKIWQIIEIITKLTVEQNKHKEVREKCSTIAFIPCLNNQQKFMKYTDHLFYPHDIDIADLFVDTLSIIKLPSFNISIEFKENFCLLFNIENLDKVIQTKIDVDNEQPSINLSDFYSQSIVLIQDFLLNYSMISADRSDYLSSKFARMKFLCVDRIQLSYCYGSNIVKTVPNLYSVDTYIDQELCKFYILKKYETSEMRYIDAMTEFIVKNEGERLKLSGYIKKLLQIYQNNAEQGLKQLRENLKQNYEPKWMIPEVIKEKVSLLPPAKQEEEIIVREKPIITSEKIEQLANEPSRRPKPKLKEVTKEEDANRLTSFPLKAGSIESNDVSSQKSSSKPPIVSKVDESTEQTHVNDETSQVSRDHEQENNEHVITKNRSKTHIDEETKPVQDHAVRSRAPMVFSEPVSLPPANFEHITVSNLTDLHLFASTSTTDDSSTPIPTFPVGTEADRITGRQGEEFVFQYLKWKYPSNTIEWINENNESGSPYDIRMIVKSENDRIEHIEVKTTRSHDQNTFPVSIGEVEYLLQHPSNYFIYRVYYADNKDSSTIIVINRIKDNLQLKRLKLSMTIATKSSDLKQ
ncbi:unnamed protein product [Adineta steineri]|uniref:Protein NO VEIN C-terminal domain-containing protein n=1 Tax=Adineta steineri TaxID=433720 RepID=A0A818YZ46_9BILA|nr:unnamed protein product [Adineta steineri]